MVLSTTYTGVPGLTYLQVADLIMVEPLRVCREGVGYNLVSSMPTGSRDCYYEASTGKIHFTTAFAIHSVNRRFVLEKIFVLYKV